MLEVEQLLGDGKKASRPVSSLNFKHVSRPSTPGPSSSDGTATHFVRLSTPPRSRPTSAPPGMAIKALRVPENGNTGDSRRVKALLAGLVLPALSSPPLPEPASPPPEPSAASAEVQQVPDLSELSRLLRLQSYEKRRCQGFQRSLQTLRVTAATTARLAHAARSVQHTLAECIRSEDKQSFANLFHAFSHAVDGTFKGSHGDNAQPVPVQWTLQDVETERSASFLDELSASLRDAVLEMLSRLRYDGDYIADRLISLSPKEVLALLPDRTSSRTGESILGTSTRPTSRSVRPLGFVVDRQLDTLSLPTFASPLEALVFSVRGTGEDGCEASRSQEVWATVCARMISDQKQGSEKLIPALLDVWASSRAWPGKDRLGTWMLKILREGQFLVEQPSKQSYGMRVQAQQEGTDEDVVRANLFYASAVQGLLALFADNNGASLIPDGSLRLCRAIFAKLPPAQRQPRAFPHFVLTRWLFSSFVVDALTLPEAHGLLTDYYISEVARQRILRQIAARCQKAIFDVSYSWKYGSTTSEETTQLVHSIAARFEPPASTSIHSRAGPAESSITMSAHDILTILNALHPQSRPASLTTDPDTLRSGVHSSSSSISGFSLFRSAEVPADPNPPSSLAGFLLAGTETQARPRLLGPEPAALEFEAIHEARLELEDVLTSSRVDQVSIWVTLSAVSSQENFPFERPRLDVCSSEACILTVNDCSISKITDTPSSAACKSSVKRLLLDAETIFPLEYDHVDRVGRLSAIDAQILQLFRATITALEERSDFVSAHCWFKLMQEYRQVVPQSCPLESLAHILHEIHLEAENAWRQSLQTTAAVECTLSLLRPIFQRESKALLQALETAVQLRDKAWYVVDVRTSAAYVSARATAAALHVMGKPKRPRCTRLGPPLRHWNASRLSSQSSQLKTDAHILEVLSAAPGHGGPNKLSDDQARAALQWMQHNNIENLCKGEERLHKLCMEVRKCVEHLTQSNAVENPVFWSSVLYSQEHLRADEATGAKIQSRSFLASLEPVVRRFDSISLQTNVTRSLDAMSNSSHPLSSTSSREFFDSRSPTLTNKSSATFWSPVMTEAHSPSSATSIGSHMTEAVRPSWHKVTKGRALEGVNYSSTLGKRLTSLLLSDFCALLFADGSETDLAFWQGLGGELSEKHFRTQSDVWKPDGQSRNTSTIDVEPEPFDLCFDVHKAIRTTLERFTTTPDPYRKLAHLYDLQKLLVTYMAEREIKGSVDLAAKDDCMQQDKPGRDQQNTPRADSHVEGFHELFRSSETRPSAIFRDLQCIAALVPSAQLESAGAGKAFWNAAIAVTGIKREVCKIMVETADSIIAYHSNNRGHGRSSSTAQQERDSAIFSAPPRTPSAEDVARYSMADAAELLQITAKEGDPAAQRELATLYLTHPELMDHIIAPFARPKDVFREELESKWRKNQDPNRCDPATMCVAHYWMSLSSSGGDALAKEYLRQREEMERLP